MTLKVIGAGFGRTGTDSMREALAILGFGPCHHMFEILANEPLKLLWRRRAKGENIPWSELFAGYNSCVDWPSAAWWPELAAAYPQAKIILTHRSAESWWESFSKTILPAIGPDSTPESLGFTVIRNRAFNGKPEDRAHALDVYERNVKAVRAAIPPSRLLVHELGDGWEPLCKFLGVPVPTRDYPHGNAAEGFAQRVGAITPSSGQ